MKAHREDNEEHDEDGALARQGAGVSWHAQSAERALEVLGVRRGRGLDPAEVERRRREHGPNQLQEAERRPWWSILGDQLKSIVVYLLGAAAALALVSGRWPEGLAVVAVIVVNTAIGFVSELKAVRSMAALRRLGEHSTTVRRAKERQQVSATELVPGDIVLLEAGELVPADLRLLRAEQLRANEASLTGESVPSSKLTDPVDEDAELADRRCMLYKGTSVAEGTAEAVVVATGPRTELGRVAELAERAESTVTPLQSRLDQLGRRLGWITVGVGVMVAAVGILVRRQEATLVVETALALGVAAIPEGLPIVATIALARGMVRMARRDALVNRLTAVETLGATSVILSDKTGTLTENQMRLELVVAGAEQRPWRPDRQEDAKSDVPAGARDEPTLDPAARAARRVLELGVLCNAASLDERPSEDNPRGDPTEIALLAGGRRLGLDREELLEGAAEVREEPFDPRVKMMATFHRQPDGQLRVAVKGAPAAVLEVCDRALGAGGQGEDAGADESADESQPLDDALRRRWTERVDELASGGLRVLAMAEKTVGAEDAAPYEALRLVGLVGLHDPPREGVKAAIDSCQAAGVRVEMVSGDQPQTARAIAEAVGIVGDADDPEAVVMRGRELGAPGELDAGQRDEIRRANIFARVSPEQKLDLVRTYQAQGAVVAMTGDGVNDAPALKKADIGVAMGQRGTEAAKQVADMVLQDDALATIGAAIEQGRVIFNNIRKSVMFMLCTNVAEVLAVSVATFVGWTLPLRPLQILYLNVLTDVFPALALGVGPGSGAEMTRPPRDPREPMISTRHWLEIGGWAALIAACVLGSLLAAQRLLGLGDEAAVTVSFLTLAFGKLWFTFNLRDPGSGLLRNEVTRNPWVWGALALCVALLLGAVYLPGLSALLGARSPGPAGWLLLLGVSLVPLLIGQVARELQGRRGSAR